MPRNFNCNCLCHGSDGNVHDPYFSCKNCYAANHMGNLPRQSWEDTPKGKPKGKKKPVGGAGPVRKKMQEVREEHLKEVKDGKPVSTQSSN